MLIYLQVIETEEDKSKFETYTENTADLCTTLPTDVYTMSKTQKMQYIMHL